MKKNNYFYKKNNYINYALNTDYIVNDNEIPNKNEFNLETKKIVKEKIDRKLKYQKIKMYEEYFKFKLKKIENINKPTPYQIFLQKKQYLKLMNNQKIKQNLNPLGTKICIFSKNNKIKKFSSQKNKKINKSNTNLIQNQLSPILYLKKIKNYKKNNIFFDKLKTDLYHYYINENNKITNKKNNNKSEKKIKILKIIQKNNLHSKQLSFKKIKKINTLNSFHYNNKTNHLFSFNKKNCDNNLNKDKYTNTVNTSTSDYKNDNNKNLLSFSNRNFNKLNNDFKMIYKEYNKTEYLFEKNDINNFLKNKINKSTQNNQQFFKNKKDVGTNNNFLEVNRDIINGEKEKNKLFLTEN